MTAPPSPAYAAIINGQGGFAQRGDDPCWPKAMASPRTDLSRDLRPQR